MKNYSIEQLLKIEQDVLKIGRLRTIIKNYQESFQCEQPINVPETLKETYHEMKCELTETVREKLKARNFMKSILAKREER